MGCCISTPRAPKRDPPHRKAPSPQHFPANLPANLPATKSDKTHVTDTPSSRAPPPPTSLEEESVKEVVLSEAPVTKPASPRIENQQNETTMPVPHQEKMLEKDWIERQEEISEVSQVSEVYSVTQSFSTTTSIADKEEDEAISRQVNHRVNRSPAKVPRKRPYTGGQIGGTDRGRRSPAKRAEPSPEKKVHAPVRAVRGREPAQVRSMQRTVGPAGIRRDSGEASGRRSRSPATRTVGGPGRVSRGGSPMKANGKGGGRSGDLGVERKIKTEELNDRVPQQTKEESNDTVMGQGNESIDNPHVSLECFIFL